MSHTASCLMSTEANQLGREAENSHHTNVNNSWGFTTPSVPLRGMVLGHSDDFPLPV
jgi:hypothetical protein